MDSPPQQPLAQPAPSAPAIARVPRPRPPIPRPRPRLPEPTFKHYFLAAAGSVLIGVTLPSLLTALRLCMLDQYAGKRLESFLFLQILALLGCGPGAVVLSLILMSFMTLKTNLWSMKRAVITGALSGIGVAFLNLPGFLVLIFLGDAADPVWATARVLLLFVVAGVTCGMWIGWQAWRGFRPNEGFLPRFTLKTMLMMVILWGTVLVAFQPDRKDEIRRYEEAHAAQADPAVMPANQNHDKQPAEKSETVEPE